MNIVYGYKCSKEELVDDWYDKPMRQYGKITGGTEYAIKGDDCVWYDRSVPFEIVDEVVIGDRMNWVPPSEEAGTYTFDVYDVNMEVRDGFKWIANDVLALTGKRVGMNDLHFYCGNF